MHFFGRQIDEWIATLLAGALAGVIAWSIPTPVKSDTLARPKVTKQKQQERFDPIEPLKQVQAKGWTGIWVGAHAGYGVVIDRAVDDAGPSAFHTFDLSTAKDALLYGVGAGYDVQLGKYAVVGILTDHSWTNAKRQVKIPVGGTLNEVAVGDVNINRLWYGGARLGWLPHPKALLFGSVGYTMVYGDLTLGDVDPASKPAILGNRGGATYGGGLEVHADSGFGLKLEYRFVDLNGDPLKYGAAAQQLANIESHIHQVMLSATFKFDSPIK